MQNRMNVKAILCLLAVFCLFLQVIGADSAEETKVLSPTTYVYKTADSCSIEVDVYLPKDRSHSLPVIVYLHSGALILNSRKEVIPEQLKLWLAAGYAVVAVDYRLAPETKLPEIISDLKDAFQWIGEKGPELFRADPQRLVAWGRSAGGYLALQSGVCVEPKPKAIVSFFGYGDVIGDWYTKPDPYYCKEPRVVKEETGIHANGPAITGRGEMNENAGKFYLYCRQNGVWPLEVGGRDPIKERDFFLPYCPLLNVTADYPPTILLHGDQDNDVPYEQSVMMSKELKAKNIRHELVTFKGGGHGFDEDMDKPEVREAFNKALEFIGKSLNK